MKPLIAVPIGDPAGIGPEIVSKALCDPEVYSKALCIVIGDRKIMENAMKITNSSMKLHVIENVSEAIDDPSVMNFIDLDNIDMDKFEFGKVNPMCGRAAYEYVEKSIQLANSKEVDAVTTTTINKEALKLAGVPYIGHTEIFGALTGTEDPLTMFEVHGMRIFFLSRHVSLRNACDIVTKDRIKDYVKRSLEVLKKLGVADCRAESSLWRTWYSWNRRTDRCNSCCQRTSGRRISCCRSDWCRFSIPSGFTGQIQ